MTERAGTLADRARPCADVPEPTVSSALVRGVLRFTAACGVSTEPAAAQLGPHRAALDDPDHRIPASLYDAVFTACSRATGSTDFGARLGGATRLGQLGVLGFLLASSPTLGAALQAYARYQRALGDTLQLRLQVRGAIATLSILPMHHSAADPQRIEALLASVHAVTQELCGRPVPWLGLSLPHVASADRLGTRPPVLQRLLGIVATPGPPRLSCERAVLDWTVLNAGASPALVSAMQEHLAPRAQIRDGTVVRDVAAAVQRRLATRRRATLASIAAELQMSPRLLQLRLRGEGTLFRAVVEGELKQAAIAFLRSGSAVAEVAHLLGFSEEASFFRAFKRWTGNTPAQVRAMQ